MTCVVCAYFDEENKFCTNALIWAPCDSTRIQYGCNQKQEIETE
jgi:hypothetical protein